jgi:hypothetical protein
MKLYNKLISIQYGDEADVFGWITIVEQDKRQSRGMNKKKKKQIE